MRSYFHPNKRIRNYILQKENEKMKLFLGPRILYIYIIIISWAFLDSFSWDSPTTEYLASLLNPLSEDQLKTGLQFPLFWSFWTWNYTDHTHTGHRCTESAAAGMGSDSSERTRICWASESFCSFKRWAKQCCGLLTSKSIAKTA